MVLDHTDIFSKTEKGMLTLARKIHILSWMASTPAVDTTFYFKWFVKCNQNGCKVSFIT